ncbi:hypothetical protein G6011_08519 [Alternaria panax]|uniref:Uncharacterized protein n=1 Tax=Alternaria panax TaxID=48097 RepID=A0AAD4FIW5_9PLEO|nr:hypothetical protein G6011_08519 [Alternaria panax]
MVVALSGDKGRQMFFESKDLAFSEDCKLCPIRSTPKSTKDITDEDKNLGFDAWFHRRLTSLLKHEQFRHKLPVLIWDTKEALKAIKNDASGRTNLFESLYRIVFRLTIRVAGPTKIAEDPNRLEDVIKMFEMIDRSTTATSVIFPKLPWPAIIQRTYAGARLYIMIDNIIKKRAASDERHDDALQHMLDQGDRAVRIVEFIVGALFAGLINSGINAAWVICYLEASPKWLAKAKDEVCSTAARHAKDLNAPLSDQLDDVPIGAWETEFSVIDMCLRDSLRLNLLGTAFRRNISGKDIPMGNGNEVIPPGAFVTYTTGDIYLDPDVYTDPCTAIAAVGTGPQYSHAHAYVYQIQETTSQQPAFQLNHPNHISSSTHIAMAPTTPLSSGARKRRVASPGSGVKTPTLPREPAIPDTTPEGPYHVHQPNTNVRSDEVDAHLLQNHGLLSLPCELLEMIASNLLATTHILNLGMVSKRMSGIVQQTIVRDLVVSSRNIGRFLGMLSGRAELTSKVSSVDVGDLGCSQYGEHPYADLDSLGPNFLETLSIAIAASTGHVIDWSPVREDNKYVGPVWRQDTAFFLNVLATSCPSIKSVTVELPEARPFRSGQPPRPIHQAPSALPALNPELLPVAPFQGPALRVFQAKLETRKSCPLTISENTSWKGPPTIEVLESHNLKWRNMGTHIITLANFSRLKRLDIPMDILGRPHDIVFSNTYNLNVAKHDGPAIVRRTPPVSKKLAELRSKVLPLTLQYLHLRSCNKWVFALLQRINEVPVEDLILKRVELSFELSPKNLLIQCDAEDLGRLDYVQLLAGLDRKGIEVIFHTGPEGIAVDMRKELEALSCLTPSEVWHCSVAHAPFSKWNPEASRKRQSLKTGFRYFLRHADHHSQLLNSPTFNIESWMQGAFFHGISNSEWDAQLLDSRMEVKTIGSGGWKERALGKRALKRRLPPLLNLDIYQFVLRIEQKLTPLPKESEFFGASFAITDGVRAQPSHQHRDAVKKLRAYKEKPKRLKQAKCAEPLLHAKAEVHDLEDGIERLRPGSANNVGTASQFNATLWAGIAWNIFLQPNTATCVAKFLE